LIQVQEPERKDIIIALQNCDDGYWASRSYYQFVNTINSNKAGSDWQNEECLVIETENEGDIVIDILKDGRIGGIEFINLIET
jgi:hypothetical protein